MGREASAATKFGHTTKAGLRRAGLSDWDDILVAPKSPNGWVPHAQWLPWICGQQQARSCAIGEIFGHTHFEHDCIGIAVG